MKENNFQNIKSVSVSRDGIKGLRKGPIIYGNWDGYSAPICYLRKPKWVSDEMWDEFLDGFKFTFERKLR